ncbi:MAG: sigma-54 dependent transcriptional regulator, partial [Massilibacteroides sp.]|nr:sigma-54 dependent transcriptional regulator [Massilibacteroides sp.]
NFKAGVNNGNEGLFWLAEIRKIEASIPIVLFTAYADIDLAVKGIKEGAADFIVKPWDNERLIQTLLKVASLGKKDNRQNKEKNNNSASPRMIWGESRAMLDLRILIEKVAVTDANILITGENGTGKEMLAREIHALSKRRKNIMIPVDMGAITETLFESELFGHAKGAFTDANTDRPGKFEAANGGSLFLDEIGNLPYHLQAKLLTVIQSRSVVRVGSNQPIPVDLRLICATNRDLEEMVDKGLFREDLLYRINTIHVRIPSLRERKEDILPLATVFLSKYCSIYGKPEMKLSREAENKLKQHPWFGNIRELEHTMEKAVIINDENILDEIAIDLNKNKNKAQKETTTLEEMEYKMIKETIDKFEGNLSLVAQQLGISRQTLYNKIKRYEL